MMMMRTRKELFFVAKFWMWGIRCCDTVGEIARRWAERGNAEEGKTAMMKKATRSSTIHLTF